MKSFLAILCFIMATTHAFASQTQISFVKLGPKCKVRVVSEVPDQFTGADILFLTGFADRADNHEPLFKQLASSGHRVISFDYPSHGETNCRDLNKHNFSTLSNIAQTILSKPQFRSNAPLYLSGWSTGGLLAYRMAQRSYFKSRMIKGLILLAPGIIVNPLPGENGKVTQESLLANENPPHRGPIRPTSPLNYWAFSSSLLLNSFMARLQKVPEIPTLMLLAGDKKDVYVNSLLIKSWYRLYGGNQFTTVQCSEAKHELDNEKEPIGKTVRTLFSNFANELSLSSKDLGKCVIID